jgi:hypothetical protein
MTSCVDFDLAMLEMSRPVESRADLELATLVKRTPKNNVSERRQANADETAPLSA